MVIKNAVIENAVLSIDELGFLTSWLTLDYGGTVQQFGGLSLYLPKSFKHHELKSVAGFFISRVMEIAEVTDWSKLKGRPLRVRGNDKGIEAIGHFIKDDWFCAFELLQGV